MTTAAEHRGVAKKTTAAADAKRRESQDAIRRERDLALREIGEQEATGRAQLADRSKRQRAEVWAEFKRKMAAVK